MVSFVIPCYNEEGNAPLIRSEIARVFGGKNIVYECILVDDGSRDGTGKVLKALHEDDPLHVTAVRFSRNFGKEAAILSGLSHAKGEFICIIDADLQQRPEVALEMYEKLAASPELDAVAAFQEQRNEGKVLSIFKKCFYKIMSRVSEITLYPGASDFRMMRRKMVDTILALPEYQRFSKGIFAWVGFETYYMPYRARERVSGTSKWNFIKLFRYALDGIIAYTVLPLKIPYFLGALSLAADIIFLAVHGILRANAVIKGGDNAAVIALLLFLAALLFFCMGAIGSYLARSYMQVKGRPVYIEKEVLEKVLENDI